MTTDTETRTETQNDAKTDNRAKGKPRILTNPQDVAGLVMLHIDQVNSKKDELTLAIKGLADTAKQLTRAYAQQQQAIAKLAKRVEELEKAQGKPN